MREAEKYVIFHERSYARTEVGNEFVWYVIQAAGKFVDQSVGRGPMLRKAALHGIVEWAKLGNVGRVANEVFGRKQSGESLE